MMRTIRYHRTHRIGKTVLSVFSDLYDSEVESIENVEKGVVEKYIQNPGWQHIAVDLFILEDAMPVVNGLSQKRLISVPPGGIASIEYLPIINVYDPRDPSKLPIFMNKNAMERENIWEDYKAIEGLLAHEHAHPLSECDITRSSRRLRIHLYPEFEESISPHNKKVLDRSLKTIIDKLCIYAPRDIVANDTAIQNNFTASLSYLTKKSIMKAGEGIEYREILEEKLEEAVEKGSLTPSGAHLFMMIASMDNYLDFAIEIAPFYSQNKLSEAEELEEMLFAYLEPEIGDMYKKLRDSYIKLTDSSELVQFEYSLLNLFDEFLGLKLRYKITRI